MAFPLTDVEVFLHVIAALDSDNASVMGDLKDQLEQMNTLGCPLGS